MTQEAKGARFHIIEAFNRLILSERRAKPRVADVLSEAGVARSTFYEHFNGRDTLLIEAMRGPLGIVADALSGKGGDDRLRLILDHFRENRRSATELLTGPLRARIVRALADLIAVRTEDETPDKSFCLHLADMQIGFLQLWLAGETRHSSLELARLMTRSAAALKAAMTAPQPD